MPTRYKCHDILLTSRRRERPGCSSCLQRSWRSGDIDGRRPSASGPNCNRRGCRTPAVQLTLSFAFLPFQGLRNSMQSVASVRRVITQRRLSQASRGVGTRAPLTYSEPITFCFAQSKTSQFREYVRGRLKGSGPELTSNVTGISERELKPQLTLVTRSLVNRFRYCTHRCFIAS